MPDSMARLLEIMARLRDPGGCPWDREQTLDSLRGYLLEESHEVLEALDRADPSALREELGDLLFQIVFQARIAEETGWFDFHSVAEGISDKLVRRHPHVFGEIRLQSAGEVVRQWEDLKEAEKARGATGSRLEGIPRSLPALLRSLRIGEKAARAGFDWERTADVFAKVREEIDEWEAAVRGADGEAAARELGDLLFALVNVARKSGIDPERALQQTADRFAGRFRSMEEAARRNGTRLEDLSPAELETLWVEAKRAEAKR
jgi:tetrapyrrole methylase family protein/MazG family protein